MNVNRHLIFESLVHHSLQLRESNRGELQIGKWHVDERNLVHASLLLFLESAANQV
jgi:hypothetical protein